MIALYLATLLIFVVVIALMVAVTRLSGRAAVPRCTPDADCACHASVPQRASDRVMDREFTEVRE